MMSGGLMNRRSFLKAVALAGIGLVAAACDPIVASKIGALPTTKSEKKINNKPSVKPSAVETTIPTEEPSAVPTDAQDTTPPP
jgi:hypothetical protein